MTRNRRAGVEDRWTTAAGEPSASHGKGKRWRARYVDDLGREHAKVFGRKADAQKWLDTVVSDQVTGMWTDPKLSGQTFEALAQRWMQTKATRAPKPSPGIGRCSTSWCCRGGVMCRCVM